MAMEFEQFLTIVCQSITLLTILTDSLPTRTVSFISSSEQLEKERLKLEIKAISDKLDMLLGTEKKSQIRKKWQSFQSKSGGASSYSRKQEIQV